MAKGSKPKAGSRAFWPRKRAKRMYPSVTAVPEVKGDVKLLMFAAYKAGMSHVSYEGTKKNSPTFTKDVTKAVTILDSPPLLVCGIKLYRSVEGKLQTAGMIWSEKLDKNLSRKLKVPKKYDYKKKLSEMEKMLPDADDVRLVMQTQPTKSGVDKKKPEVFEAGLSGDKESKWKYALENIGKEIKIDSVFEEGEYIDASSVTTGKGTQGPVKRFGVVIRERKAHGKRRHIGNIGAVTPGRVLPGKIAMAGQHGFQTRTEFGKRIMKIGVDGFEAEGGLLNYGKVPGQYLLVEGSVVGPKKRLIMLRKAMRATEVKEPVELKYVSSESQQ
ncbi:MAG: 50S ribosomal protein L3 [Candidatus Micrarchaeota archaeon]|nr:50S ribosomal protein L3 [Candidatus Micrarchaeota archaeon]